MNNNLAHWPLFAEFPALQPVLDPVALATLPTPVQALPALGANAWVKRDDLSHTVYGGNKVRKLEFVVAEMRRSKAHSVYTLGATGTNAGIAASMVSAREGMSCTIITFPQPESATVAQNRQWLQHFRARFEPRPTLWRAVLRYYLHPARLIPGNYFLFAGCSNPVSTFGYVNAAFELREQIRAGECPEPAEIIVPVSSASTLAGLTLGVALAGLKTRVTGIRVTAERLGPFAACTAGVVEKLETQALAQMHAAGVARQLQRAPAVTLSGDYFGTGYGEVTPAAEAAIAVLRAKAGLELEGTYSGKAAAAFLNRLTATTGPVLFWNTFNSRPLPAARGA
ncbi:MAG: 1-aminocyclopropane-carboxylate deaminase [Moraxellaceae bacterium]|jgi:D-cysteine desulfhydrase|nr:1-aminocyclopropane-carboxylate deaminase [Moraxellaceae bacterium]